MSLYERACMSFAELRRVTAVEMVFSGALLPPFCISQGFEKFCAFEKCSKKTFLQTWML